MNSSDIFTSGVTRETSRINQDVAETMIENKKSSFQKNATR